MINALIISPWELCNEKKSTEYKMIRLWFYIERLVRYLHIYFIQLNLTNIIYIKTHIMSIIISVCRDAGVSNIHN